ncbi:MAG: hypothetical protein K0S79_2901, partial [Nitrospira sp.]|nr:hypothetical protein [Nitrospira sp.]
SKPIDTDFDSHDKAVPPKLGRVCLVETTADSIDGSPSESSDTKVVTPRL